MKIYLRLAKRNVVPIIIGATGCLLLFITGCPRKQPPEVVQDLPFSVDSLTDATGRVFSRPVKHDRIISLTPSITRNVYLLESHDKLVGVTGYCPHPKVFGVAGGQKEIVGSYQSIDIEKIIRLKPDFVLVSKEGEVSQFVAKLRRLDIPVFVFSESINFEGLKKDFSNLGALLGCPGRAEELIKTADRAVSELKQKVNGLPETKVLVELNTTPLIAAGPDTFIDEIITSAGGINIARETLTRWPQYSLEQVVLQNPEVIIITGMDQNTAAALKAWEQFPQIKAVKNKRIHVVDSNKICQPGINNFVESLKMMIELLHPEIKNE